jgi:hypothetical protein
VTVSAGFRPDKQILEVDARLARECRIIVKEQREADDLTGLLREQDFGIGARAEQMFPKLILVQLDPMRKFFVVGQSPDELSNGLCIFRSCGSNHEVVMWLEVEWRLPFAGLGPIQRKSKVSKARSSIGRPGPAGHRPRLLALGVGGPDWNTPAIDFYQSLGAVHMDESKTYRLTGEALAAASRSKDSEQGIGGRIS